MGEIEDLLLVLWFLTNSVDLRLNYRIDQDKEDLKRLETVKRTRGDRLKGVAQVLSGQLKKILDKEI